MGECRISSLAHVGKVGGIAIAALSAPQELLGKGLGKKERATPDYTVHSGGKRSDISSGVGVVEWRRLSISTPSQKTPPSTVNRSLVRSYTGGEIPSSPLLKWIGGPNISSWLPKKPASAQVLPQVTAAPARERRGENQCDKKPSPSISTLLSASPPFSRSKRDILYLDKFRPGDGKRREHRSLPK